jgi:hypothetical protein
MKIIVIISLTCCLVAVAFAGQPRGSPKDISVTPTYELYSWKASNGNWSFCLLYTTNRQKTAEEVLREKTALHGIEQLKKEIDKLEKQARIVWFDRLISAGVRAKGSESLGYPPRQIIDEVKQYAAARRNIQVSYWTGGLK